MAQKRKIPATIVTQHPDNAGKPYWHNHTYISSQFEAEEAYRSFSEIGATEYKWDWEGKLVDESLVERFFGEHFDYFSKHPIGKDVFLTFRLPNPRVETEFRLGRAFINMASAASVAKHFKFSVPPLFEVILPLTESAEEMIALQEAFQEIHFLKHPLYKLDGFLQNLLVIPLFESVATIIHSDEILKKYIALYKKHFKKNPPYIRPYLARSDPALNSGIIATVLAIKIALSHFNSLSKKTHVTLFPMLGAGSLPFRGGLNPKRVEDFVNEYAGIKTVTLQSAFRYDYPLKKVTVAVTFLEKQLPKTHARDIPTQEEKKLQNLIMHAEKHYQKAIVDIAPLVNKIAQFVPKRRERFLHVGLFGYSRGRGKVKLPRAITFTCALYSIGIPPEFIGTGTTIAYAIQTNQRNLLEKYYVFLKKDLEEAGRFLNKTNLQKLARTSGIWKEISDNIRFIESYLGKDLGPKTKQERKHALLTEKILTYAKKGETMVSEYIRQAGILRRSLG